jgi:hypothetical protein
LVFCWKSVKHTKKNTQKSWIGSCAKWSEMADTPRKFCDPSEVRPAGYLFWSSKNKNREKRILQELFLKKLRNFNHIRTWRQAGKKEDVGRRSTEICWGESRSKHNQAEATEAGEYLISEVNQKKKTENEKHRKCASSKSTRSSFIRHA